MTEDQAAVPTAEQPMVMGAAFAAPALLSGSTVLILSTFISVAVACLALLAYDRLLAPKPRMIAVVSLQTVLDAKQAQFADVVSRSGATEDDRTKALHGVNDFASDLAKQVAAIAADCDNCVVLLKDAVVGNADVDLTPKLMSRLGIADMNVAEVQGRIRRNVGAAASAPAPVSTSRKQEALQ